MKPPDALKRYLNYASSSLVNLKYYDLQMMVDPLDVNITPVLRDKGAWEEETTEVFKTLLKPGDCFVDCGAHWGYYSLLASKLVGDEGIVYAFEPLNFAVLNVNIALNRLTNVVPMPFGVWNQTTVIYFALGPETETGGGHVFNPSREDKSKAFPCQVVSLDQMFKPREVDFIKVDTEGSDMEVLYGAYNLLKESNPRVMVETPPIKFLTDFNYEITHRFVNDQTWILEKPTTPILKAGLEA